jgi:hypothetical protein
MYFVRNDVCDFMYKRQAKNNLYSIHFMHNDRLCISCHMTMSETFFFRIMLEMSTTFHT